jgi:hypothetical protein
MPRCASQLLLSLQELYNLSLLLLPESITFKRHGRENTIDLAFSSFDLSNTLTVCHGGADLYHESDHFPIYTLFVFSLHLSLNVPKPLWRKADKAELSLRARELNLLPRNYKKWGW